MLQGREPRIIARSRLWWRSVRTGRSPVPQLTFGTVKNAAAIEPCHHA